MRAGTKSTMNVCNKCHGNFMGQTDPPTHQLDGKSFFSVHLNSTWRALMTQVALPFEAVTCQERKVGQSSGTEQWHAVDPCCFGCPRPHRLLRYPGRDESSMLHSYSTGSCPITRFYSSDCVRNPVLLSSFLCLCQYPSRGSSPSLSLYLP